MQLGTTIAACLSGVAFLGFGTSLLISQHMITDFTRYGLARYRVHISTLQIAGSVGIIIGLWFHPLLVVAAGGLALMMIIALIVRRQIGDPLSAGIPAFVLLCLNLYVLINAIPIAG